MLSCYAIRNETLKTMGYSSYADYLSSDLWANIRRKAMRLAKGICWVCCGAAMEVHHLDYSLPVLKGVLLGSLKALCSSCHEQAESDSAGNKVSLSEANRRLEESKRRKAYSHSRPNKKASLPSWKGKCSTCGNSTKRDHAQCRACEGHLTPAKLRKAEELSRKQRDKKKTRDIQASFKKMDVHPASLAAIEAQRFLRLHQAIAPKPKAPTKCPCGNSPKKGTLFCRKCEPQPKSSSNGATVSAAERDREQLAPVIKHGPRLFR